MSDTGFERAFLLPKYWPTWFVMGFWWLMIQLPLPVQTFLANCLGDLLYGMRTMRVRIARRNLELCFPELTEHQRKKLLRENMRRSCMAVFETGISWWWSTKRILRHVDMEGLEQLENIDGQGALLLGIHFVSLEIGGAALSSFVPLDMVYRPHNNILYDYFQRRGRVSNGRNRQDGLPPSSLYDRNNIRAIVKALKSGRMVWSGFDQDLGRKRSIFVPFFGISTATVPAASTLAKLAGVRALSIGMYRQKNGRYLVKITPSLANFPSHDQTADTALYNQSVESLIRECPESYLWVHRRFKTRPPGEPDLYAGI